jgi:phosphoglycolate phosphatase
MPGYDLILFDLDGTLVDSAPGITASVAFALSHFGIFPETREELLRFIGPPLSDSFKRFYGFSEERAGEAVDLYRVRYRESGVYEFSVYEGIGEALSALNAAGLTCAVATSKPGVFAETVLEKSGLKRYFAFVAAAELDDAEGRKRRLRMEKKDVIEYCLESLGVADKKRVLMVGDRKHDIVGAHLAGVDSLGVLFGFGSREELEEAGADHIAETPADIIRLILNKNDGSKD